jgi:hypothetical protein
MKKVDVRTLMLIFLSFFLFILICYIIYNEYYRNDMSTVEVSAFFNEINNKTTNDFVIEVTSTTPQLDSTTVSDDYDYYNRTSELAFNDMSMNEIYIDGDKYIDENYDFGNSNETYEDGLQNIMNNMENFIMLHSVDMSSSTIYDYLTSKEENITTENPQNLRLFNVMRPYELTFVTTYGKGALKFIKHGTHSSFNNTNYFSMSTILNRIHLLVGSNLYINLLIRKENTVRILIRDKENDSIRLNLIFYPNKTPIHKDGPKWVPEHVNLPNKMLIHYKAISTVLPTTLQFELVIDNKYNSVAMFYNLSNKYIV